MLTKAADPAKIPMRARLAMLLIVLEKTPKEKDKKPAARELRQK
jgi:hypothetical protein